MSSKEKNQSIKTFIYTFGSIGFYKWKGLRMYKNNWKRWAIDSSIQWRCSADNDDGNDYNNKDDNHENDNDYHHRLQHFTTLYTLLNAIYFLCIFFNFDTLFSMALPQT